MRSPTASASRRTTREASAMEVILRTSIVHQLLEMESVAGEKTSSVADRPVVSHV